MQYLRRAVTVLGVLILFAGHFKAFCDEGYNARRKLSDDLDISVSLDTILKNGGIEEIVFPSEETDNPYYSKLDWSAANVFFIGLSAEVTVLKQLSFRAAVHTNVNDGFGFMEDYDWKEHDSSQWTHYSKSHSNAVPFNTWLCDFNILYQFPKFSYFKIYSGLGIQYQRWSFEDELISFDYPADTETDIDQYKGKNSISYRVNYFFPEILIGGDFEYKKFKLSLLGRYGFLAYIDAYDNHKLRDIVFHDTIFPGHYLAASLVASYTVQFVTFSAGFTYETMLETRGYSMVDNRSEYKHQVLTNQSGNSFEFFNVTLGIQFNLLAER